MTTRTRKITVDEFEAMAADPGHRYELVDGELVDMDGTPPHGNVTGEIYMLIRLHVRAAGLLLNVGVSTGFRMDPYTLRFPDVQVTSAERMAAYDASAGGWPHFAPDVAIEVVSAQQHAGRVGPQSRGVFRQRNPGHVDCRPRPAHGGHPSPRSP